MKFYQPENVKRNNLDKILNETFNKDICNYTYRCDKDCDKDDEADCQVAKFYNRYGLNYRSKNE